MVATKLLRPMDLSSLLLPCLSATEAIARAVDECGAARSDHSVTAAHTLRDLAWRLARTSHAKWQTSMGRPPVPACADEAGPSSTAKDQTNPEGVTQQGRACVSRLLLQCSADLAAGVEDCAHGREWLQVLLLISRLEPSLLNTTWSLRWALSVLQSSDWPLVQTGIRLLCRLLAAQPPKSAGSLAMTAVEGAGAAGAGAATGEAEAGVAAGKAGNASVAAAGKVAALAEETASVQGGGAAVGGGAAASELGMNVRLSGKRSRSDASGDLLNLPPESAGLDARSWRSAYDTLLAHATQHPHPAVREAAMEGLCQVMHACASLALTCPSSIPSIPGDWVLPAYQAAVLQGLNDSSKKVRLAACSLASRAARLLGRVSMSRPAPSASRPEPLSGTEAGRRGRAAAVPSPGPARRGTLLLQFGKELNVSDDAYQRLCGLLMDPCSRVKACALQSLPGLTASSSRVRLQAFSKKVTLIVEAASPVAAGPHGLEVEETLLDEAVGAFVNASEDEDEQVRCALARVLPELSRGMSGKAAREVDEHAADYLIDLMHDEASSVRVAASASLLQLMLALTRMPLKTGSQASAAGPAGDSLLDEEHVQGVADCMADPDAAVRSAARNILLLSLGSGASRMEGLGQTLAACWASHALDRSPCWDSAQSAGRASPQTALAFAVDVLLRHPATDSHDLGGSLGPPAATCTGNQGALSRAGVGPADAAHAQREIAFAILQGAFETAAGAGAEVTGLCGEDASRVKDMRGKQLFGAMSQQRACPDGQDAAAAAAAVFANCREEGLVAASLEFLQDGGRLLRSAAGLPLLLRPFISLKRTRAGRPPTRVWLRVTKAGVQVSEAPTPGVGLYIRPGTWFPLEDVQAQQQGALEQVQALAAPPKDRVASVSPTSGGMPGSSTILFEGLPGCVPGAGGSCRSWGAAPDLELQLEQLPGLTLAGSKAVAGRVARGGGEAGGVLLSCCLVVKGGDGQEGTPMQSEDLSQWRQISEELVVKVEAT